jgi:hypothetical protein
MSNGSGPIGSVELDGQIVHVGNWWQFRDGGVLLDGSLRHDGSVRPEGPVMASFDEALELAALLFVATVDDDYDLPANAWLAFQDRVGRLLDEAPASRNWGMNTAIRGA